MSKIKCLALMLCIITLYPTNIFAQPVSWKDLVGNWQSTNSKEIIKINFIDSSILTVDWKGFINHVTYSYSVGLSDKGKDMLNFHDPGDTIGHEVNTFIYLVNINKIKITGLDLIWSRLPLYDAANKNKIFVLARQKMDK